MKTEGMVIHEIEMALAGLDAAGLRRVGAWLRDRLASAPIASPGVAVSVSGPVAEMVVPMTRDAVSSSKTNGADPLAAVCDGGIFGASAIEAPVEYMQEENGPFRTEDALAVASRLSEGEEIDGIRPNVPSAQEALDEAEMRVRHPGVAEPESAAVHEIRIGLFRDGSLWRAWGDEYVDLVADSREKLMAAISEEMIARATGKSRPFASPSERWNERLGLIEWSPAVPGDKLVFDFTAMFPHKSVGEPPIRTLVVRTEVVGENLRDVARRRAGEIAVRIVQNMPDSVDPADLNYYGEVLAEIGADADQREAVRAAGLDLAAVRAKIAKARPGLAAVDTPT